AALAGPVFRKSSCNTAAWPRPDWLLLCGESPTSRRRTRPRCADLGAPPDGVAGIAAGRCAGLMHHDLRQPGQPRLQAFPDPYGEPLAGRILETRHLVQAVMIELVEQRRERGLDVGVIHHPAEVRVERAGHVDADA